MINDMKMLNENKNSHLSYKLYLMLKVLFLFIIIYNQIDVD